MVSNHVSHSFARRLEARNIAVAEWVVLRQMFDQPIAPSEIARMIGMTRGAVSKLVDRLIAKGLAHRENVADDRRYQRLTLTPEGKRLVPELEKIADQNDLETFSALTPQERDSLRVLLMKLANNGEGHQLPIE